VTVPEFSDTTDLRSGPEIHAGLLEVLPLVGDWAGRGTGTKPGSGTSFDFAQRLSFGHDGRPFLHYSSHAWLLDADGSVLRPAFRETGFLRPGAGDDELEFVVSTAVGIIAVYAGLAGDRRWEFATSGVGFTPTAKQVAGERRLYGLTAQDELGYVTELALEPGAYQPHLNARLARSLPGSSGA